MIVEGHGSRANNLYCLFFCSAKEKLNVWVTCVLFMSAPSPPSITPSTIPTNHPTSTLPSNLRPIRAGTWALVRTLRAPAKTLVSDTQPPVKRSACPGKWARAGGDIGGTIQTKNQHNLENPSSGLWANAISDFIWAFITRTWTQL